MIEELENVRKKFPGAYDDLTDSQLAGMLATKYPAYKDLPERLSATGHAVKMERAPGDLARDIFKQKQAAAAEQEPGFFEKLRQAGESGLQDLGRTALGIYKSLDPTQAGSALEAGAAPILAGLAATPPAMGGVVAGEATRKGLELAGAPPTVQALAGTAANIAVPGGFVPRAITRVAPRPAVPTRTIDDLLTPQRQLPPPAQPARQALPGAQQPAIEAPGVAAARQAETSVADDIIARIARLEKENAAMRAQVAKPLPPPTIPAATPVDDLLLQSRKTRPKPIETIEQPAIVSRETLPETTSRTPQVITSEIQQMSDEAARRMEGANDQVLAARPRGIDWMSNAEKKQLDNLKRELIEAQKAPGTTIAAPARPQAQPVPEVPPALKQQAQRTPLDILKGESGALGIGREDPMAAIRAPHEMGSVELARRSLTNRTKNVLNQMGPTGKKLSDDLADAYYAGEQRKGEIATAIDKIRAKYPTVKGEDLFQVESGRARPDVAAAYREIKAAITDPIGDEAALLKIKVKNPITGVEREFRKRKQYVPHVIDQAKAAKNPTRMVDSIMEELIADGIEPGAARTQATMMVRNMSKKSGSLQFMRTGKFDPDIHVTDGWEAYKRAAQGEVDRIEALKRFGKVDEAGLRGDEIGGIRERTANISAEAGPEAAQKAELWATRQLGMQRGEIDTVQKKAGELMRNFNTLKLGFMPVTNIAAQMPQILAAGKTTRFNPIKSFEALRQSFGKSGEGAKLAKLFAVGVDNTADDIMRKFETARSGPGGKAATAFLHYTGGLKSENFVSKLASYVGNEDARYVIQKLLDNPTSKSAQKVIRNYGLDPAKVLSEGATDQNIFRIARKFADETLLRGNVLDLPPAFSSESGKVFFQFKRATQVLGQQMYDAAKNDPSKLIALIAASQLGGEALLDIKAGARGTVAALLSGDPDKVTAELRLRPKGVRRILDNWAAALSFGYLGDTVMDVAGGAQPKNLISGSTVAASPFESALHITQGAGKIARGEKGGGKQILGGILREVPGGTFFRGLTRPEEDPRKKLMRDLGLEHMESQQKQREKLLKDLGIK